MPFQTLSLTQSQRQMMIMAPQLRQSLEILQLPIMELKGLVQREMEQNPTIDDVASPQEIPADTSSDSPDEITRLSAEAVSDNLHDKIREADEAGATPEDTAFAVDPNAAPLPSDKQENQLDFDVDTLKALDDAARDYFFDNEQVSQPFTEEAQERRQYMFDSLRQPLSLQQHLVDQLGVAELSENEKLIGEAIIGDLNDDGFLTATAEDLAIQTAFPAETIEKVLKVIQQFDPPGIAARDLRECLLLQIVNENAPEAELAEAIIDRHLEDVAGKRYPEIAEALDCSVQDVERAVKLIQALNPRPANGFGTDSTDYITPEVFVEKDKRGKWRVVLDDNELPHIRISTFYQRMLRNPNVKADVKSYIRERIRSGQFLLKSIEQRQNTIHRIASAIVEAQQDFLNHGISKLKPMTMAEIADKVGVHETTVSRAVANKYMKTPVGVFELRYFFSHAVKTASGNSLSNKTVQDKIQEMVAAENPKSPLSDQAIQKKLAEQGVEIARRTVAKYRMLLKIPQSHLRRQR